MAEPTMVTGTVAEVDVAKESFKIAEGNIWVSHTKPEWRKGLGPPLSVGLQISFEGYQSKGRWYANNIVVISQPHPATSYAGLQQAAAERVAPSPAPATQAPRNEPEPLPHVPGTNAYRDTVGIPRTACLKDAGELLASVYAGGASELLNDEQLDNLASNITRLANRLYQRYYLSPPAGENRIAEPAMPDDTLVPTPSQSAEPPPEWTGD